MMRNLANPKLAGGILLLMGAAQFNVGPVKANDWMTGPDLVPDQIPYVGPRLNPTPMQLLALLGMASGVALMMD